jgi:hypothetical protein
MCGRRRRARSALALLSLHRPRARWSLLHHCSPGSANAGTGEEEAEKLAGEQWVERQEGQEQTQGAKRQEPKSKTRRASRPEPKKNILLIYTVDSCPNFLEREFACFTSNNVMDNDE